MQLDDLDISHELLHDEGVSHHHDDDGSIHFDASEESAQHVQDHSCASQPAGLFVPELIAAPIQLVETITLSENLFIPDPMLEQPHRPPAPALG